MEVADETEIGFAWLVMDRRLKPDELNLKMRKTVDHGATTYIVRTFYK